MNGELQPGQLVLITPPLTAELSMFTPEQIAFIEDLVDRRIAAHLGKRRRRKGDYHTVPELRDLTLKALPALMALVGGNAFSIDILRFHIKNKTVLRPGDHKPAGKTPHGSTRFDAQVANAINSINWPECPIVKTSRMGYYRIRQDYLDQALNEVTTEACG